MRTYRDNNPGWNYEIKALPVNQQTIAEICVWTQGNAIKEHNKETDEHSVSINVPTSLGFRRANPGDYVIQNSKGEFFVMEPRTFEAHYEEVSPLVKPTTPKGLKPRGK